MLRSLPGKLGQAQLHGADAGRLSHGPIFLLLNKRYLNPLQQGNSERRNPTELICGCTQAAEVEGSGCSIPPGALHKQCLPKIGTQLIAVRFFEDKKS